MYTNIFCNVTTYEIYFPYSINYQWINAAPGHKSNAHLFLRPFLNKRSKVRPGLPSLYWNWFDRGVLHNVFDFLKGPSVPPLGPPTGGPRHDKKHT